MNSPPTDATKCDTSLHPTLLSRDKCQLLQGSCSLVAPCPSCSCLHLLPEQLPVQQKDWRYLEVFEGNISNTSNHLTWSHLHFLCNSLIGLITRLCRLHYKMTCTCHKLPPARQHPWFGSKNALFIHKVVRDWPVWKHLTFIPGWSRVGHGSRVTHYGPSNFTRFDSIAIRLLQDLVLAVGLRAVGQARPKMSNRHTHTTKYDLKPNGRIEYIYIFLFIDVQEKKG